MKVFNLEGESNLEKKLGFYFQAFNWQLAELDFPIDRDEFQTTRKLLDAIANAAKSGLSCPESANGMAIKPRYSKSIKVIIIFNIRHMTLTFNGINGIFLA